MTTTTDTVTAKQVVFIQSLLKERDMDPTVNLSMTKKAASALIDTLKSMPKGKPTPADLEAPEAPVSPVAAAATPDLPATDKQINFLRTLLVERESGVTDPDAFFKSVGDLLTKPKASKLISDLLAAPKVAKVTAVTEAASATSEDIADNPYLAVAKKGDVHVLDGEYYRIHLYQHSKKPYAAKAKVIKHAVWGTNEDGTAKLLSAGEVKWVSAYKLILELSEATLATKEEAHAFGKMLGRCCFCSLKIDTPESVSMGYGPQCAAQRGLEWGSVMALSAL